MLVDVEVLDHGIPVKDLHKEQFHVFEDGKEQPILSFEEQPNASRPNAPPPTDPNTFSNAPQYAGGAPVNVLLLDALNTQVQNQGDVRRQMIRYLEKVPAGTPLALYALGMQLRVLQPYTTDAAAIVRALNMDQSNPRPSPLLQPSGDQMRLTRDMQNMGNVPAIFLDRMRQFEAEQITYNTDARVGITLQALRQLGRALGGMPGRKTVIWFSGSFPLSLVPDGTVAPLFDPMSTMRDYDRDLLAASLSLAKARVAVYPIDASGLSGLSGYDAEVARKDSHAAPPDHRLTSDSGEVGTFASERENSQNTMRQLAHETGGEVFLNNNDFTAALRKAVTEGASYYTVSIAPQAAGKTGKYHHIKVVVDGGKYSLAYRPGYVDEPTSTRLAEKVKNPILEAVLLDEPPASQVQFKARILPASDPEIAQGPKLSAGTQGKMALLGVPVKRVVVDSLIDARTLACAADTQGTRECKLEVLVMAFGDKKKPVNYADRGLSVRLKPEQFQKRLETGIPVRMELDVPAGAYQLRVAVRDVSVQTVGSIQAPLTVN